MDVVLAGFIVAVGIIAITLAVRLILLTGNIAWKLSHWEDSDGKS